MMYMIILTAVLTALAAFGINAILTPLMIRLAHRFKWYDLPDRRKIHTGLIPRLGGPGIFISLLAACLLAPTLGFLVSGHYQGLVLPLRLLAPACGILIIHLVGLIDDFKNLRALLKFALQLAAAAAVTSGGYIIPSLTIPYFGSQSLGILAYPITVLWIVAISNAVNLIDGMDGLAGGIAAFAALSMGIIALIQGQAIPALFALSLFGATAGFLVYNFPPAKIFMGDSGSYLLGFCLAVLPLMGISKVAAFGTLILPITLLTVPIVDTTGAIIRRLRQGRSIASPDKEHIHHKLLQIGLSERQILAAIYAFSVYLSVVAITSVILPKETNVYLILVVWLGSLLAYGLVASIGSKQKRMAAGSGEMPDEKRGKRGG
jgi:UDP-GlcNAc:undecaprenyl-phosphate GlcNAc-1-phosphate transferase